MANHKKSYKRRIEIREAYDYVLIVSEGSKSEPNYLSGLCVAYQLNNANIKIAPGPRNDPLGIVKFAEEETEKAAKDKNPYDKVFCVFDRDGHDDFDKAVHKIRTSQLGKERKFFAITSCPCFEVWLLLHFTDSTAPFSATGKRSACDNVIRELEKHVSGYAKGDTKLYSKFASRMGDAMTRAKRLEAHNKANKSKNPATSLHQLIEYLCKIKS